MKAIQTAVLLVFLLLTNCKEQTSSETILFDRQKQMELDKFNNRLFGQIHINSRIVLDSLKYLSDTVFADTGHYFRTPKATLYINSKAQTKNQVFENPKGTITAIAYFREGKQINVAEYYPNGQIMCQFPVTHEGERVGRYQCYYEDGRLRHTGYYMNGYDLRDSAKDYPKEHQ